MKTLIPWSCPWTEPWGDGSTVLPRPAGEQACLRWMSLAREKECWCGCGGEGGWFCLSWSSAFQGTLGGRIWPSEERKETQNGWRWAYDWHELSGRVHIPSSAAHPPHWPVACSRRLNGQSKITQQWGQKRDLPPVLLATILKAEASSNCKLSHLCRGGTWHLRRHILSVAPTHF